ncbi:MAG: carbohydrate-binding domain-containing protein [Nocardioides sp.]|uniref:carbohydrate-binding domain-containing protein n=1 Tax=Nocardioides sp. TaxID=35761 RepID=UPI0039E2A656
MIARHLRPAALTGALSLALAATGLALVVPSAPSYAASAITTPAEVLAANQGTADEDSDLTWDASAETSVTFSGTGGTASGADASAVTIADGTATISAAGVYRLSGSLTGQIVVTAPDALVRLVLDGLTVTSSTTAALEVTDADRVVVLTADGSSNTLTDATTYADTSDDAPGAALYASSDLVLAGSGALTVHGRYADGIASSDGLVIRSGSYVVDAVDDGIRGKDHLYVKGGDLDVTSGGDGLKSTNDEKEKRGYVAIAGGDITVDAGADGIDAVTDIAISGGTTAIEAGGGATAYDATAESSPHGLVAGVVVAIGGGTQTIDAAADGVNSTATVAITGGTTTVSAGDDGLHADVDLGIGDGAVDITTSTEGIEGAAITIAGGSISVISSDDGVNASSDTTTPTLAISGGELAVYAQGDGVDSNGTLTFTGGTTVVAGPTGSDNSPLDADGTLLINGGTVLAVGSSGMVQTPSSSSTQGWLAAKLTSTQTAGTILSLLSSSNTLLATYVSSKAFGAVIYSSPSVTKGQSYKIYKGGTATCRTVGGLAESGTVGTTLLATVTAGTSVSGGGGGGSTGGGSGTVANGPSTAVAACASDDSSTTASPTATASATTTTSSTPTSTATTSAGATDTATATSTATASGSSSATTSATSSPTTSATASATATTPTTTTTLATTRTKVTVGTTKRGRRAKLRIAISTVGSSVAPTGTVVVYLDGRKVRTVSLTSAGTRTITLRSFARKGKHRVTVVYRGSTTSAASTGTDTYRVR